MSFTGQLPLDLKKQNKQQHKQWQQKTSKYKNYMSQNNKHIGL